MSTATVERWLEGLGYASEAAVLHRQGALLPDGHPYASELNALLQPEGAIRAQAVFDVEGVPTVVFVEDDGAALRTIPLDEIRKRIWNQNLASIVIEVSGDVARAMPVKKLTNAEEVLELSSARPDGPFSALDVRSANVLRRKPTWFDVKDRVDQKLLENLSVLVAQLTRLGFASNWTEELRRQRAELLMGQVLFISYLEHRDIVGATYRERRGVSQLHTLIRNVDRKELGRLIDSLRKDFNGDFLGDDRHDPWSRLNETGFGLLDSFLRRTELSTGQQSFWNYDFSFLPVELLSGLYETFLSTEEQAKHGAYYTPRNLAMLAVDQAFLTSTNPLEETIFDGACGSGILLTTAYRRLIALSEAKERRQLGFRERGELLLARIFGADINAMACRVTAFSLYLSLLEGLAPADIMEAQDRDGVKLPTLAGRNLSSGNDGDFFVDHTASSERTFSLLISNPPWAEPQREEETSADLWARKYGIPYARRQIAGAYALHALDYLREGGRICLILPIGQFLGKSSEAFVEYILRAYRPTRLINFGDLQNLLFPTSENTCHVFVGSKRSVLEQRGIPLDEVFDYLVPKADLSLALGRLTMQSADRHILQTSQVASDPQILVTLMWGDRNDISIWTRLSLRSTFADFWGGTKDSRRWIVRKGVHLRDRSKTPVSAKPLMRKPFVPITALSTVAPLLHPDLLETWPKNQETVANISDELLEVFDGPRVLFPDGFSRLDHSIRAVFYEEMASFTHSVGVIKGPQEDRDLLRFVAVYLRSTLAKYFLMLRAWKMLCERNGVHLADVESFPFFDVESAPDPIRAKKALRNVSDLLAKLKGLSVQHQVDRYAALREQLDEQVFDYFDLKDQEKILIRESVEILMPSIRPRSFQNLYTPSQRRPEANHLAEYAKTLAESLTDWRMRTGGKGWFEVEVVTNELDREGSLGIVRVLYKGTTSKPATFKSDASDSVVQAVLRDLRAQGMDVIPAGETLQLIADSQFWLNDSLYLVRLLNRRSWTVRQALRDAESIVHTVQRHPARAEREEHRWQ